MSQAHCRSRGNAGATDGVRVTVELDEIQRSLRMSVTLLLSVAVRKSSRDGRLLRRLLRVAGARGLLVDQR